MSVIKARTALLQSGNSRLQAAFLLLKSGISHVVPHAWLVVLVLIGLCQHEADSLIRLLPGKGFPSP